MLELSGFCGGEDAVAYTPTTINDIDYIEAQGGMVNDLMATKNTDFPITDSIPGWDYDTVLYGKYAQNPNAGNVDWNTKTVSDLIIKSRPAGTFEWNTVAVKPISSIEDFDINYVDYLVPSGETTEYALVPMLYGAEGNYESTIITPEYDRIFIIEEDQVFSTGLVNGGITITRNIPSANVELLNSKYPIFVRNTIANYDTGQVTGLWIPAADDATCDTAQTLDPEYDYARVSYEKEFVDFLADSKPKIIKDDLGQMWIAQIMPNITVTPNESYAKRNIDFTFVEIGDYRSEEDRYYLGLSNVSEEWWSR